MGGLHGTCSGSDSAGSQIPGGPSASLRAPAKQSIFSLRGAMDCRVASLLAMTANMPSRSRGARRPEFCWKPCSSEIRGRREDRVRAAPAVSRACLQTRMCTRAYRNSGEHPAFPAQWLYGLYVVVLVTGFVVTIATRSEPHNLTPAPGRRTLTTSPYATTSLVRANFTRRYHRVHRNPPHVRDDGRRPSGGTGWRES